MIVIALGSKAVRKELIVNLIVRWLDQRPFKEPSVFNYLIIKIFKYSGKRERERMNIYVHILEIITKKPYMLPKRFITETYSSSQWSDILPKAIVTQLIFYVQFDSNETLHEKQSWY